MTHKSLMTIPMEVIKESFRKDKTTDYICPACNEICNFCLKEDLESSYHQKSDIKATTCTCSCKTPSPVLDKDLELDLGESFKKE